MGDLSAGAAAGVSCRAPQVLILGKVAPDLVADLDRRYGAHVETDPARRVPPGVLHGIRVALIRSPFALDREAIDAMPVLRGVVRAGSGSDAIDTVHLARRGIAFHRCPLSAGAVAELAFALLLCWARQVRELNGALRRGEWRKYEAEGTEIAGKTAVVVGFGQVGQAIARIARGFGAEVLAVDRSPGAPPKRRAAAAVGVRTFLTLEQALPHADFLFLSCPLTPATAGLIDAGRLALLPRGAVLVNVARGNVVDAPALLAALERGHLGGACLDVFAREPAVGDPLIAHPRVVATPHVGAQTREAVARIGAGIAEVVDRLLVTAEGAAARRP